MCVLRHPFCNFCSRAGRGHVEWSSQPGPTSQWGELWLNRIWFTRGKRGTQAQPLQAFRRTGASGKTPRNWKNLGNFLLCKDRECRSELCPVVKPPHWDHSSCAMSIWTPAQVIFPMFPALSEGAQHCSIPQSKDKPQAWLPWGREMKVEKDKDGYRGHQCV